MLRLDLCGYCKRKITVEGSNDANKRNKKLNFKNNACLDHAYKKPVTHL